MMNIKIGDVYEINNEEYTCFKILNDESKIYYGMQKFSKPLETLFIANLEENGSVEIIENNDEKQHILELIKNEKKL